MQRFHSSFPDEWPGLGLLLLRLTLAGGLFADALVRLHQTAISQVLPSVGELVLGAVLLVGLWTPIAGVIVCLLELLLMLLDGASVEPQLHRAAIGLSLALLGPGAWSIDARLFGRRRVDIKNLGDD
jgi:putative oxidoreductase